MVWRIAFFCPPHWQARANTLISNPNPGSRMHSSSMSETSLWRQYYRVGDDFMELINAHNPQKTTLDVCALPEHLADQMHSLMTTIFPADYSSIYQQDNAPCHTDVIVREGFQEHSSDFQVMSWPQNSFDTIEHLWFHLEIPIRAATYRLKLYEKCRIKWWALGFRYHRLPIRNLSNWSQVECWRF